VAAGGEFISHVQVHVLFETISRGWSHKVEGAFGGERWKYFLCELQRTRERKKDKKEERFHRVQSTMPLSDDEDEELQETVEVSRREAEFQRRAGERYEHGGGSGAGEGDGSTGIL
jgi:hypothetical protein